MTVLNKPGYSHTARSGDNLSKFIKNELTGAGIQAAYAPSFTYVGQTAATGLTAAGTNLATGLQLAKAINVIGTAASGTGVILPAIATCGVGAQVFIINNGANAIKVYTGDSSTVDGTAGATGVALTNARRAVFIPTSSSTWISALLGAVAS